MKKPHWTDQEVDILEKYYSSRDTEELQKLLPRRSWESILHRASRQGTIRSSVRAYLREQRIMTLPHDETIYIAGILDGEGMLTVTIKGGRIALGNGVNPLVPLISITNTSQPLIDWLHPRLGGCTLKSPYSKGDKWKIVQTLQVARLLDIKSLIEQTLPYLIVKRQQAALLLEFCNTRLQDKWSEYNPQLFQIAKEIRNLNRKGRKMAE